MNLCLFVWRSTMPEARGRAQIVATSVFAAFGLRRTFRGRSAKLAAMLAQRSISEMMCFSASGRLAAECENTARRASLLSLQGRSLALRSGRVRTVAFFVVAQGRLAAWEPYAVRSLRDAPPSWLARAACCLLGPGGRRAGCARFSAGQARPGDTRAQTQLRWPGLYAIFPHVAFLCVRRAITPNVCRRAHRR